MLQLVGDLLGRRRHVLNDLDVRHFIERYLRKKIKVVAVYCESYKDGYAVVRVSSPVLQQEVRLLEYELKQALKSEISYHLKELRVRVG